MLTFKPSSGTTQFSNYTGSYHICSKRARSRGGRSETGVVDKLQKNRFEVDKIHRKNYNEFIECYKNYIESFYVFYKSVLKICVIANYRIL